MKTIAVALVLLSAAPSRAADPTPEDVLAGLKEFYRKTARDDGSFRPGVDPDYRGMSDSAYSDLAPTAYAAVLHRTFGWKLPHDKKTREFLLSRQQKDGAFVNGAGTVDPKSPDGRAYNTTMGLMALRALDERPRFDARPIFADVLREDYKKLPPYTTSFFPLSYLLMDEKIPADADKKIKALMVQADDGYMLDHVANTFHAVHYYRLVGEPTPKAEAILKRVLKDQKADGSWMVNLPSRDRHATFDAVFTLRHLAAERPEVKKAVAKAASWALSCRNADGGFGHFPGSTSDADANYFHVGTLVMAGWLKPADGLPKEAHLFGWGHLMALPR